MNTSKQVAGGCDLTGYGVDLLEYICSKCLSNPKFNIDTSSVIIWATQSDSKRLQVRNISPVLEQINKSTFPQQSKSWRATGAFHDCAAVTADGSVDETFRLNWAYLVSTGCDNCWILGTAINLCQTFCRLFMLCSFIFVLRLISLRRSCFSFITPNKTVRLEIPTSVFTWTLNNATPFPRLYYEWLLLS